MQEGTDALADLGGRIEQYELIRPLGRGGMGMVCLARDTRLGRLVAIKLVRDRRLLSAERFRIEARATARCVHENIVVIHEIGDQAGRLYMVLEYLSGLSLKQWIARRATQGQVAPVPVSRAIEIITPVVRAMVCAHAHGIVHRDLKPSNIMLTDSGVIKVLDFGVAKLFEVDGGAAGRARGPALAGGSDVRAEPGRDDEAPGSPDLTIGGLLVGSQLYMSPEQRGADEVDHRSDIWAVGMILFELVTGHHPVRSRWVHLQDVADLELPMPRAADARPDVGKLGSIIDRCLIKRKADRIGSARELLDELEALAPRARAGALGHADADAADDATPYAGLAAFQEGDADRFFGRTRDVAAAVARLREQPFMAIVGPSGAGKSSFVRAGLVPALKRSGDAWEALIVRPGRHPLAALAALLDEPDGPGAERLLREQPGYLGAGLRARARRKLCRTVIFVDQLEELYTLGADADERRSFAACLEGAADDAGSPLRVVVSLRSDFLDRITETPQLMNALVGGLVLLPPIERDGLRESLTRPLEALGYRFESAAMVDDMLDALAHTRNALPLLQFTASKLWETRDLGRQLLTEVSYAAIGGVAGTLASHADAVLLAMSSADRALARQLFERLVTPERTRAIASLVELRQLARDPEEAERVLTRLVEARLLVVQPGAERAGSTAELVHESLIERWPMLSRWLSEPQEDAAFLARLRGAAREWRASGRPQGLLWRDEAMIEAQRWRQRTPGELPAAEAEFLGAVLGLAQRTARRRRLSIGALVMTLVLTAGAMSYLAWSERRSSQRAREQARETQLAAAREHAEAAHARDAARLASARELERDPTLALALLREVEAPSRYRAWPALAAKLVRAPVAQVVLDRHEGIVWTAELSPDGRKVVTAAADAAWIWNADGSGSPIVLRGHLGPVWRASFSADGKRILTASWDRTARVWNADGTGTPVVLAQPERISWAELSADGTHVVTSSWDKSAWVWKADGSGTPVVLRGHRERIRRAIFSPDGRQVVTASFDHTARIWNADGTGAPIVLAGHTDAVWSAAYSRDGTHIATASDDGTARVWNADGSGAPVVLRGHGGGITSVGFSPDGRRVVTTSTDGTARIWRTDGTGAPLVLAGHQGDVYAASFSPDGLQLATCGVDKTVRLWDAAGSGTSIVLSGHERGVLAVAYSRDGRRLVSASGDRTARLWNTNQPDAPRQLTGPPGLPAFIDVSADGSRLLATWKNDDFATVWKVEDRAGAAVVLRGHTGNILHGELAPDGGRVVTSSADGTARVWNADGSGTPVVLRGHSQGVGWASFSPDGARVATASDDGTARVWNADGSGVSVVLEGQARRLTTVLWSSDGEHVLTLASEDSTAWIWDTRGARAPVVLRGHTNVLHGAAFSPDGQRVVTASADNSARVWNADGSGVPIVLSGHTHEVRRAVFSPDGGRVVSVSDDGTARVWRADGSGVPVVLRGHESVVQRGEFSADGERVVTGSEDTARVWRADGTGVPIVLDGHAGQIFETIFSPDGTRVVTAAADGTILIWPHVTDIPSIAGLIEQLWRTTPYCMPVGLRMELLGVTDDAAWAAEAECRARVARGPAP